MGMSCVGLAFACAIGAQRIFTSMPVDRPLMFIIQGFCGVAVSLFGIGCFFTTWVVVVMAISINRDIIREEGLNQIK